MKYACKVTIEQILKILYKIFKAYIIWYESDDV